MSNGYNEGVSAIGLHMSAACVLDLLAFYLCAEDSKQAKAKETHDKKQENIRMKCPKCKGAQLEPEQGNKKLKCPCCGYVREDTKLDVWM